ncbi:hypothetical protein GCK72_017098 [Caenorhabditis remanei]|uniref:RRM domain-containing protein n=1 Tax=Caenorhabditis remanei TaxID=31234 RepID=A0A6A5G6F6_CAERE|nr:hypothetical protein GCK72_017098 [Caenorhabditis remanei]KAF1750547.1 hypothetical protein GCK72_017098 [Caenorhabditis remanei]
MFSDSKRAPTVEPTLMIGDVDVNFDFTLVNNFICLTYPYPIKLRKSPTKVETKVSYFYQYPTFADARLALRRLNGLRIPGMSSDFQLDMNFTKQREEVCAHLTVNDVHLSRCEVMRILFRFPSVLGLAQYNFDLFNGITPRTTCFVRFGDKEECMEAVRELNQMPIENSHIHMTLSTRYLDKLRGFVMEREAKKQEVGVPQFHNIYSKRRVNICQYNEMVMSASEEFFEDMESSRWSPVAYQTNVHKGDYVRQMTLNSFDDF